MGGGLYMFFNGKKVKSIEKLKKESQIIQSLCENSYNKEKYIWEHHLPLKDRNASSVAPANWSLDKRTVYQIIQFLQDMDLYAYAIVKKEEKKAAIRNIIPFLPTGKKELLPPWIVFPLSTADAIHWKIGIGREYANIFEKWIGTLSEQKHNRYFCKYPKPEYLSDSRVFKIIY